MRIMACAALVAALPGAAFAHHDDLGEHLIATAPVALPLLALAALALRAATAPCRTAS
ncbi:MAG TPA: hypothetical protein VJ994_06080 [Paracoccaceae bacterium]|nr:hypothetical protein [Paracoccaceae bacterium]